MRGLALPMVVIATALGAAGCGGGDDDAADENRAPSGDAQPAPEAVPTLDSKRVEAAIEKELDGIELFALDVPVYPEGGGAPSQTQLGGGRLKVRSVTCPPDVPQERGGTFTCELDGGDNDGTVELEQLNAKGSRLSFKASIEADQAAEGLPSRTELKGKLSVR